MAPLVHPDSSILILGTMPGDKAIELQQYFAHRSNQFWKLLFAVFGEEFSTDYAVRKMLLQKNHIALWTVLASCERSGSMDQNIRNEAPNDINELLKAYPKIKHVFFESVAARKYFSKHVEEMPEITYGILPSPSSAFATMGFEQKLELWKALRQIDK